MLGRNMYVVPLAFLLLGLTVGAPLASAKDGNEYDQIVKHLKTKYGAKKVRLPGMWLARFVVSMVRPAGVKSFNIAVFDGLAFSGETLDAEMQKAMRSSMGPEWSSLLRVRSREGSQVYMYMRESGSSVNIMLVTIDKKEGAIIRATINPEKLAEFINDPKIFGVSLNDNGKQITTKSGEEGS